MVTGRGAGAILIRAEPEPEPFTCTLPQGEGVGGGRRAAGAREARTRKETVRGSGQVGYPTLGKCCGATVSYLLLPLYKYPVSPLVPACTPALLSL